MEAEMKPAPEKDVCPGAEKKRKLGKAELEDARERLAAADGPEFWRSLEELAGDPQFQEQLGREFPKGASEWLDPVSRRGFLKLMSASIALAGLTACTKQPLEPIVPYVRQPEELIPGRPMFYATAMTGPGYGMPMLVESHEGRPTKAEGNPEHPASLGSSDIFMQASVLDLYDPDRSQNSVNLGTLKPWTSFIAAVRGPLLAARAGAGLRFLTTNIVSPSLAAQMREILGKYPGSKWFQWDPVNRDNIRAGAMMAFGADVDTQYRIAEADVILSLDADFLNSGFPGQLRYAREYASRRRVQPPAGHGSEAHEPAGATQPTSPVPMQGHAEYAGDTPAAHIRPMNRMYMIEASPTVTGAKADHKMPASFFDIEHYARLIATRLGINAGGNLQPKNDYERKFIDGLVKDLQVHRGSSAVIVGREQPPVVHAIAHAINDALGNTGRTVVHTDPVVAVPVDNLANIRELAGEMNAGQVDVLVIMGGNPVYNAPADLKFKEALAKVPTVIHYGLFGDETAEAAHWHINGTHYLEAWGDTRAFDGTVSITQPLIAPLYDGRSEHEFLSAFSDKPGVAGYEAIRTYWQAQMGAGGDFEKGWRKAVHDGFVPNSELPVRTMKANANFPPPQAAPAQGAVTVVFRPDPTVWDGRWANNGWLQELPKPMLRTTWDNAVLVSPKFAQDHKLKRADEVEIEANGAKIRGPVWITPGHPDNQVTLFLGYGRARAGRIGTELGFNVYPLRTTAAPYATAATVRKTGKNMTLASPQGHQNMEGRRLVRVATLDRFNQDPHFAHEGVHEPGPELTLYRSHNYTDYKWGMQIDQGACVGCNACVVACQAENNIPVVGKQQVLNGRHMQWLRIDTYYQGDAANPRAFFQPVPCMHCENAPCEPVCPVAATVHSGDGLNDMVYNRCIGTRYCSNNCPYKVRRFNFLLFQDWDTPQTKLVRNPDVSVRPRGVMEKCTYCVQRIRTSQSDAEKENRKIRDGEVMTACQQACPADAIVFGDLNDRGARVTQLKQDPRTYGLLTDLNTRPRTNYMAVVRNPNPEIPEPEYRI